MKIKVFSFFIAVSLITGFKVKSQTTAIIIKRSGQDLSMSVPVAPPDPGKPSVDVRIADPAYIASEKSKLIIKSYKTDANDKLNLSNQYGNISINTWSKPEIKVQIEIKAFEGSDNKVEELLESVSIADSKAGNEISFRTSINRDKFGNSGWSIRRINGREERRGVQVNYTVFMPAKLGLEISNKYGSIELPDYAGIVSISSSYGSFKAASLTNAENSIRVSYGSADIESLQSGNLNISYGSLKLGSGNKIDAEVKYSSAKIGKLSGNSALNLRYCSGFKISEIDNNVKNLNVNAAYSSVSLGFDPAASFEFDVTVSYCGFKYQDDRMSVVSTSPDNARGFQPTKNYKGQIGKRSEAKVTVNSKYGSVQFL